MSNICLGCSNFMKCIIFIHEVLHSNSEYILHSCGQIFESSVSADIDQVLLLLSFKKEKKICINKILL